MDSKLKTSVLLLAFGAAASLGDIEAFLKNILKGNRVTERMVEHARARYARIGGGSPLLEITRAQGTALEAALKARGRDISVYVGMRYWDPYIRDTLGCMKADGVERAVALIMAPHYSRVATGGYAVIMDKALEALGGVPTVEYVDDWHTHPVFIEALVEKIQGALSGLGQGAKDALCIFSAHSLPVKSVENDTYVPKLMETIRAVTQRLPLDWKLGYQSKSAGPAQWLGPGVEEVMEEAAGAGRKSVVVVPFGFVADHVETLYDIDVTFKEKARELGLGFARSASLNASPRFIDALVDILEERLGEER